MSGLPEVVEQNGDTHVQRPPTLIPLLGSVRGEGYGWPSLDVVDLDPPTPILPYAADQLDGRLVANSNW